MFSGRITAYTLVCVAAASILFWCPSSRASPQESGDSSPVPSILILNSYHQGYHWSDEEIVGLLQGLRDSDPRISPMIEHLDLKRHPTEANEHRLLSFLSSKYRGRAVDLIIILDNPAFEFMKRYREEILPSVPVVFAGINNFEAQMLEGWQKITGLAEVHEHGSTLSLALSLHPGTRRVLVVHDHTSTGIAVRKEIEELIPALADRVRVDFISPSTYGEAISHIAELSSDSLVLLSTFATDREGKFLNPPQSTQALTAQARVPVYATLATRVGHGVVGGIVISGEEHGRRAAAVALRVLAGEDPSSIPVETSGTSVAMFDYRQLERFGVGVEALPPGSQVVNRPVSYYEQHKTFVITAALAVSVLALMVLALVWLLIQQNRAKEALRASEESFRQIVETANEGIWVLDSEFRTTFVNQRMADMLGYSVRQMSGRKIIEFVFEEDLADASERSERRKRGVAETFERRFRRSDGGTLWTITSTSPLRDSEGRFAGSFGMYTDITERRNAEEALKASEEKYRLLVDTAQEAIFVVQDTHLLFGNPRCEEILGYSANALIGKSVMEFIHPDDRPMVVSRHYRRLAGEIFPSRYTIRIIDRNNKIRWAEIESVKIDWAGKPAVMVFLNDITYKKLAEEAAAKAERLRAVAELSAGVSHNFNNLLQIIVGNASLSLMVLETGDLAQIKTSLEQMLEAATFGAETVRRLQSFANLRGDMTEGEGAVFDITATVRNAAEITSPLWKTEPRKKGIKINLELDLQDNLLVEGKENELFEAIVNLIRNAIDALPDGGDLVVKTYQDAEEIVIEVRDTGTGIRQEDLENIFQPFWTTKGVGLGTGMGLAVTLGIVQRHGGTISVESRQGKGTTFTIRLPCTQKTVEKTQDSETAPTPRLLTILVIDDMLPIVSSLERICAAHGHRVLRAVSGEEAIDLLRNNPVDLLVCDLVMPGMTGWDVGKAIRSLCLELGRPKPPFILLTGWDTHRAEPEKMRESGVDALVGKPVDSAILLATIQEIADRFNVG